MILTQKQKTKQFGSGVLTGLTTGYLVCMLSVYLLYPGRGGYADITTLKWYAYLMLSGIYAAAIILLRVETALAGGEKLHSPLEYWAGLNAAQKLVIVYWIASGISTAFSIDRATAFFGAARCDGFFSITLYCVSFLLVSRHVRPCRLFLWVFGAAMTLNCILCLFQFAGLNPLSLYPDGMNYYDANKLYSGEFLGTIGNADLQSAVLALAIPLFAVAIIKLRGKSRFLLLLPLTLCVFVLAKARVAGGVVGVIGCALIAFPVLAEGKGRKRAFLLVSAGVCVIGVIAVYCFGGRFGGTVYEMSEILHGRCEDSFGSSRIFIWRHVLQLIPEKPLFGGGPDTLGLRMPVGFERYDEELGILIRKSIDAAHNEYLNILVNQGVFAFLACLGALFCTACRWVCSASETPAAAICGSAVLAYCIQAFFGLGSPISSPFFWIAFAVLVNALPSRSGT